MGVKKMYILILLSVALLLGGCSNSESDVDRGAQTISLPDKILTKPEPIPKFGEITHIPEKKEKFFTYLQKKVAITNDFVWAERQFIISYREKLKAGTDNVTAKEQEHFSRLADRYGFEDIEVWEKDDFDALLTRVDVVPASLVLAQGANESAWGTSRFATQGKNFFGIWCYQEGCGIKPSQRKLDSSHEVRQFRTVQDGVNFYVHNINIGHAFESLRATRADLRADRERLDGIKLASGLVRYSERGLAYVEEIQKMIKQNNLSEYNIVRSQNFLQNTHTLKGD